MASYVFHVVFLFFVDIFPYIIQKYPKLKKDGGYKLSNVYEKICNNSDNDSIQFHNAMDDVNCLIKIYKLVNLAILQISKCSKTA